MLAATVMHAIIRTTEKSEKLSRKNQEECVLYLIFTVASCCGALLFTDLTFSSLMTFGAALQFLGFGLLLVQVIHRRGTKSISVNTLMLYAILLSFRLYATTRHESYIPVDRSGDYLYQTIEAASLALVIAILSKMSTLYADEYTREDKLSVLFVIAICAVAASYVHANLNQDLKSDRSWTFSIYIESVAMLPQLFLLTKLRGEVECLQGHYMACTFASRLTMLRLWGKCYTQIYKMPLGGKWASYGILWAHIVPCILLIDFMYLYLKSFRSRNTPLTIEI